MTSTADFSNRYLCETRRPGKKSHEFPTPDAESARAVCDAQGWEFIRIYQPGTDSDRRAGTPAKGARALSPLQMKCLVTEANRSWKHLSSMGVTTEPFEDWRHAQVWECVRREGLRSCTGLHYRKLLSHFRALRGAADPGGRPAKSWSREAGDTMERREQILHTIARILGTHARRVENPQTPEEVQAASICTQKGGVINEGYLLSIARAKNRAETLNDIGDLIKLPASKLDHLQWTLSNRIATREGRGKPENRNKSQRKKDK